MFQASSITIFLFILTILLLGACSNPIPVETELLTGKWELLEATRSGQKSKSLEGAYLKFLEDSLQTNMLGDTTMYKYTLEQNVLHQYSDPEIQYLIEDINQDSLVMTSKIMKIDFTFLFLKARK